MRAALALALVLLAAPAWADEDDDLAMIPKAADEAPAPPAATARPAGRLLLENAANLGGMHGVPVPIPGRPSPRWQDRTSLDLRWEWHLSPSVSATISDRLDYLVGDGLALGSPRAVANNLREAYVTWEAAPRTWLEAGRINLRNGVALGYNPTDFFRAGTAVSQASADPQALRENRLGAAMLRAQHVADWGSVAVAYAPRLYDPTRIGNAPLAPLDPRLDRTNQSERLLVTIRAELADLSPEIHLFSENGRPRLGASISRPIGSQIIAYAEWAGGPERGLIDAALDYGMRTGTLPANQPRLPGAGGGFAFRNDVAAGFSWTGESKVTVNLEYIFHEAGFSRSDWRRWFALGRLAPALAGEMWYLRAYAADRQIPSTRQQVFLRAEWPDGIFRDVTLAGLAFVSLDDASAYAQLSATWNLDRQWSAALYAGANIGPARSDHGSLKQAVSATAQLRRFF